MEIIVKKENRNASNNITAYMTICMIKIRNNYGVFMQLPLAPLEDATALKVMKATNHPELK